MLTEKNIHTTEYRQSDSAGTIAFSSTNYWSSETTYPADAYDKGENNLKPIVDNYVSYLNTKLTGTTGSLLTYSQAKTLGCDNSVGNCSANSINGGPAPNPAPSWVYSTSYWTVSARVTGNVWVVSLGGYFGYDSCGSGAYADGYHYGVRPVITIPTSEIQ